MVPVDIHWIANELTSDCLHQAVDGHCDHLQFSLANRMNKLIHNVDELYHTYIFLVFCDNRELFLLLLVISRECKGNRVVFV